jgi:hypothetical protein
MKKVKYIFILVFSFIVFAGAINTNMLSDKITRLEINGVVADGTKKVDSALVVLYQDSSIAEVIKTEKNGKFQFKLKNRTLYKIVVHKPHYISKSIQISTKERTTPGVNYSYSIKLNLNKESNFQGIESSKFDFPMALIRYYKEIGYYAYDRAYDKKVKIKIRKLQKEAKNHMKNDIISQK